MERGVAAGVSDPKCKELKDINLPPTLTELNNRAIWSLSSCKTAYGIEQLLDNNTDTYWQSDGPQPHLVNIMFRKKTPVSHLAIYTDLKADESYTPNRISIRIGTHFNDLVELRQLELKEPSGWFLIELSPTSTEGAAANETTGQNSFKIVKTFMVQLAVLVNHQNGRDTHIRQIKIFGPRQQNVLPTHFAPITSQSCIIR